MLTQSTECRRLLTVRLNAGEDIVQSIRAAAEEHGLRQALILSGVGSVDRYHFHVVETPGGAIHDVFLQGEGPFDILSLSGMVLEGRVHAHITLGSRTGAIGGHLEEGSRILTFGMVVLAEVPGVDLDGWDAVGVIGRRRLGGFPAVGGSSGDSGIEGWAGPGGMGAAPAGSES